MSTKSRLIANNVWFILVLVAILLGDVGRFPVISTVYLSILDIAVTLFVLRYVRIRHILADTVQKSYIVWASLVFFMMVFTLLFNAFHLPGRDILVAALYPIRWGLYALLPLGVMERMKQSDSNRSEEMYWRTLIGLALLGFLQLIFFPNLGVLQQFGFDPHYFRLVSTWLDPNFVGPAFILGMLFIDSSKLPEIKKTALIVALFLALLATFSRSSYLAFAASGLAYVLMRRSWSKAILVGVGICILYFSFSIPRQNLEKSRNIDRTVSAGSRLISYSQGLQIFETSPIVGVGYNTMRYQKKQLGIIDEAGGGNSGAGIDSSWILIVATMGSVGLFVFVSFWIRLIYLIFEQKVTQHTKLFHSILYSLIHATAQEHALVAFLIGWSIHSWFVNSLFFTLLNAVWGIALGLVLSKK